MGAKGVLGGWTKTLYNNDQQSQNTQMYNMEPDYWGGQAPLLDHVLCFLGVLSMEACSIFCKEK